MRTQGTTKTKTTLSTKRVFDIFCFQEQKTVLENTKQTGPYILILIGLLKSLIKYPQLISQPYENKTICFYLGVSYCICCGFSLYYELNLCLIRQQYSNIFDIQTFGFIIHILIIPPKCTKIYCQWQLIIYVTFNFPSILW